jgi:hypothetical protein
MSQSAEEFEEDEDFVTETEEAVVALIVSGLTKESFKTWFNSQEFEDWISGHADAQTDEQINQKVMDLFRVRQMLGG